MKCPKFYYRVYSVDEYGDVEESKCFRNYNKSVQFQNDLTRKSITIAGEMIINNFTFEHLTKEDLGVNVEEVVNTNLYKLIRSCIENENTLFYNSITKMIRVMEFVI